MKKLIQIALCASALTWNCNPGRAMEEPTNYPPSPVGTNTAPYAGNPALVDTNAIAKPEDNTTKADLDQRIATAVKFLNTLQGSNDSRIPSWVINQAKGVLFLRSWRGSVLVGGAGGWGIGMRKIAGGFSNPAFYRLEGASVGAQAGVSEVEIVAFLMSDKSIDTLTENKLVLGGDLHAVAGSHSATASTLNADIVLYQQASGLDVGATLAAAKLIIDNSSNRIFYGLDLTPVQIFASDVQTSDVVKSLTEAFTKPLPAPNGSLSFN
jgi:lipid-binding SYLF domain-containing protein